jgi:hypothetical protein
MSDFYNIFHNIDLFLEASYIENFVYELLVKIEISTIKTVRRDMKREIIP